MQTEKIIQLEARIRETKQEIMDLPPMRPGHLSTQYRTRDKQRQAYPQLSYTFRKKGHTDYVRADDLERISQEVESYKVFKEIVERLYALSIELSKAKSLKYRKKNKNSQEK